MSRQASPASIASPSSARDDEEALLGLHASKQVLTGSPFTASTEQSPSSKSSVRGQQTRGNSVLQQSRPDRRVGLKWRPTAVRVIIAEVKHAHELSPSLVRTRATESTPLIKAGVTPDLRKTMYDGGAPADVQRAEQGLGRMIELGLPLIM